MSDWIETETTPVATPAAPDPALPLSRREFLKLTLGASGVALVASLPADWAKPVVEAALLPPHAQTTSPSETPTPTATPIPVAPSQLSATVSAGTVALSWSGVGPRYQVERSVDKVAWTALTPTATNTTTLTDTAVVPGVTYYYRVRAIRSDNTVTEPSNIVSATP